MNPFKHYFFCCIITNWLTSLYKHKHLTDPSRYHKMEKRDPSKTVAKACLFFLSLEVLFISITFIVKIQRYS